MRFLLRPDIAGQMNFMTLAYKVAEYIPSLDPRARIGRIWEDLS